MESLTFPTAVLSNGVPSGVVNGHHTPMRPMAGRLSQRVLAVPPSGIRKYFDIAATMEDVVSLGIGEPDFVTPPPILQAGIQSLQRGHTSYTSNSGTYELREAVANNLHRRYGATAYDIEKEVLITVGVSEAMYLAMQAILDPGDEVIVPQPCFVSYTASVILAGGNVVDLPTYASDNFEIRPEAIRAAITPRTKALLIGFPSNPTGAVMDMAGMLEIARIAEEHDLIVISDEIYDRLVYAGHHHIMFAALPGMAERTIHLGGMSKDYAMTGWRIGYAAGPADLIGAMRKIHQYLIMSAPTVGQAAALAGVHRPGQRGVCAADGGKLRPPPPADPRGAERDRAGVLRAEGRVLRLPQRQVDRHERTRILRAAAGRRARRRHPRQRVWQGRRGAHPLRLRRQHRAHRDRAGADGSLRAPARVGRRDEVG